MANFVEIYDNALPDDLCDSLIALFNREENSSMSYVGESKKSGNVTEVRTMIDPLDEKPVYVSAKDMALNPQNYTHDSLIGDLDYILQEYIFDYNKKYMVWSSKLNMDLIPTEEQRKAAEEDANDIELINNIIHQHGEYMIIKYKHPDDGYFGWHTDWGPMPEFIGRQLVAQFYLNDVEDGGETEFYHQKKKVKPKKGRLVIWPVGFTHTHKGNNPISNDKYVLSCWFTVRNLFR